MMAKFATYTGELIDYADIKLEQINLIDIAHHLSNINRFGGALDLNFHYSVAEHSILLAQYVLDNISNYSIDVARYALMHDAAEYILGDVNSILKQFLPDYKKLEAYVSNKIFVKYGINTNCAHIVHALDKRIRNDEAYTLNKRNYKHFDKTHKRLGIEWLAVNDDDYGMYLPGHVPKYVVYESFLAMCSKLWIEDDNG